MPTTTGDDPTSLTTTRQVFLGPDVQRSAAINRGTIAFRPGAAQPALDTAPLFEAHHLQLAQALEAQPKPGVMVFVLGPSGVQGSLWLSATDALRSGTVGRHSRADLYLDGDGHLSLRHCLVLVRRLGDGVRIHVLDLSSTAGLRTEDGQRVRAVDADGHCFLQLPGCVLAFFPTGAALPWDKRSATAFATLAPRVQSTRSAPPPPRWDLASKAAQALQTPTSLVSREGPIGMSAGLRHLEEASVGSLVLRSDSGMQRVFVGPAPLDRGVVIGRDGRCEGNEVLADGRTSRVHALLVRRDDRVYLVDAGSTNGVWHEGKEVRCLRLDGKTEVALGSAATLVWEPGD
jgi:hypothetical protein